MTERGRERERKFVNGIWDKRKCQEREEDNDGWGSKNAEEIEGLRRKCKRNERERERKRWVIVVVMGWESTR